MTDRPAAPCPICGKPADAAQRPFCGPRCAEVDLGRWLTGQYRIAGPPGGGMDDEVEAPAQERSGGA